MKMLIVAVVALMLVGCASAPMTKAERTAYATRVCQGETANQQGVVISQFARSNDRNYAMHECLYKHGVRD